MNADDDTQAFTVLSNGTEVNHYRIIEKIGAGGMGEVYLAEDTTLNRKIALKFLPQQFAQDSDIRARFVREAQAAAKLYHPNIITVHEVGEFKGRPFFAMEYVIGNSLKHYAEGKSLSIKETIDLGTQICEGLSKAHQSGVVHRDIKPANIVVDTDNRVKILDFGLAALQGSDTLTKSGSTLGTIAYMSPEQAQGKLVDQRSDLFSFGVVLYELITGRKPFKRDSDPATLQAIVSDDPEPLARFRSSVPEELQRIVTKLLERDLSLRYQSASDIIADLKKLAITGSWPRMTSITVRKPNAWKYIAAVSVLVVVAALLWINRGSKGSQSSSPTNMTMTPVTSEGNVESAAIAPDGNYIAYAASNAGEYSLWIKNIASASRMRIMGPNQKNISDLCYSKDGSYLYFASEDTTNWLALYRIPVLGGESRLVLSNIFSRVTFSPDGKRMAFLRVFFETGSVSLVTANIDGTAEETVVTTRMSDEESFGGTPAWSPDGTLIAITMDVINPSPQRALSFFDAATGKEVKRVISNWIDELSPCWLPDGSGVLLTSATLSRVYGDDLWLVSYPEGTTTRITNDLTIYRDASITADGKQVMVVQHEPRSGVWLVSTDESSQAEQVLYGKYDGSYGLCWVGSSSLIYRGTVGNNVALKRYSVEREESQVIVEGITSNPVVSQDGSFMIYRQLSDDYTGLIRADLDGRNRTHVAAKIGDIWSYDISPDGKWLVFATAIDSGKMVLNKMVIATEEITQLTQHKLVGDPIISPDGRYIACAWLEFEGAPPKIAILPSSGGNPLYLMDPPERGVDFKWSADGASILCNDVLDGVDNIWSLPIDGSPRKQITHLTDKNLRITRFDLSSDGKTLAICRSASSSDVVLIEDFQY